jgi:hypothetical protein
MRTVDVIVTLLAATDKLVLVSLHGDRDSAVWLHREAISIAGLIESDHNCIVTLPAQLARKKKLISYVSRPHHPNSVYHGTGRARRTVHRDAATTLERWSVRRSFSTALAGLEKLAIQLRGTVAKHIETKDTRSKVRKSPNRAIPLSNVPVWKE